MRRQLTPWIGVALIGVVFGVVYRYFLDDPGDRASRTLSEAPCTGC